MHTFENMSIQNFILYIICCVSRCVSSFLIENVRETHTLLHVKKRNLTHFSMDSFERDVKMLDNPYGTKNLLGFGTYAATYKQDTNSLQKIEMPSDISVVAIKKFFPTRKTMITMRERWQKSGPFWKLCGVIPESLRTTIPWAISCTWSTSGTII